MTTITTDTLIKSISAARNKDNLIVAITNATKGKPISEGVLSKVEVKLKETIKSDKAEQTIGSIMSVLKAAEALPKIQAKAKALFESETRKGSVFVATRAGIAAWNKGDKGDNALTAAMAEKCPAISKEDKAKAKLASLLKQAKDQCVLAGMADMSPALEKLLASASK